MGPEESILGIVSYGIYLPEGFETAEEIAPRAGLTPAEVIALGIRRKCRPADEDQPIAMAVKAAKQAFHGADGIEPKDVDLVLWTGEEYKDYIAQTASIRLQEEVGCKNAWAFDLVDQGITTVLGLRIARDMMIGDQSIDTVLLAGGTRNVDLVDYTNPNTRWMLAASASGGAMLLRRGHRRNPLLETTFLTDPDMADEVYVPGGGTIEPFSPENLGTRDMYYGTPQSQGGLRLSRLTISRKADRSDTNRRGRRNDRLPGPPSPSSDGSRADSERAGPRSRAVRVPRGGRASRNE